MYEYGLCAVQAWLSDGVHRCIDISSALGHLFSQVSLAGTWLDATKVLLASVSGLRPPRAQQPSELHGRLLRHVVQARVPAPVLARCRATLLSNSTDLRVKSAYTASRLRREPRFPLLCFLNFISAFLFCCSLRTSCSLTTTRVPATEWRHQVLTSNGDRPYATMIDGAEHG